MHPTKLSQPTYHMTTTSSLPQYQAKVMFPRRGMHRGESRGINKERSRYFDFARAGSKHYRFVDGSQNDPILSYLILALRVFALFASVADSS
jgi:hypothetical protein